MATLGTKAVIERPRPTAEYAVKYWEDMDKLFFNTIKQADTAFITNIWINRIVVALGVILLAYSMIYSALKGLDVYSVGFGGIGVVAFITTFFFTTQKNVQKAAANSSQMQILYKAFNTVWETVGDGLTMYAHTADELIKLDDHLATVAKDIAGVMQQSVREEKKP